MARRNKGFKQKVTDEELLNLVESGVANSTGDWLNSSDLTRERLRSTYEFAGVPVGHLAPQGVSSIVDTSTTEVIEAYNAVLSDLFLSNSKLARFVPMDETPGAYMAAKEASMITNYCLFKKNNGWEILQSWMKSALLWKNGIIRWDYIEDYDYNFEEYEEISQEKLDELLADENVEIVGELEYKTDFNDVNPLDPQGEETLTYVNVRIRRKIDKSRVTIENIAPESFRISRDAKDIYNASFVGIQTDMTRSDIRKNWPDIAKKLTEEDWDSIGPSEEWLGNARYSEDIAARKLVTGQEYWQGSNQQEVMPLEANREVTVTECWMRVDRDGDGISELKRIIIAGEILLHEEDVDMVPLASITPIDIPFEFYGLSMADFARSSTLASTAILRGFVENTYLTNFSPKMADPNVVDFSALQNMKPKQIIPVNGNPANAVAPLAPETLSTGTVPVLEHLQTIKEQATGMSKAAQGLNDALYVSGNSETKLQAVQSASQKRIQHIARRFAETGFKYLIKGVYETMRRNLKSKIGLYMEGVYKYIDPSKLPKSLECEIMIDVGENSNANKLQKLQQVGQNILPALNEAGAGMAIKAEAPTVLATKMLESMGLDSNDFLEDYTTDEFKQRAAQALQEQSEKAERIEQLENRNNESKAQLNEANVHYVGVQAQNAIQDNARQLAIALDKSMQEWQKLHISGVDKGTAVTQPTPEHFQQIYMQALQVIMATSKMAQEPAPETNQPQGGN